MKIRDLWKRLVSKFRKNRKEEAPEPVIVIEREEAPEPEPERKTSDEMIVAMQEMSRRSRMKTDRNDTNDRKACLLVLAYWLYKVINGGNVIKTTFRVAEREIRSFRNRRLREKEPDRRTLKKAKRTAQLKDAAAAMTLKGIKTTLKKQRVY